jgi:hypothetical protein
VASFLKCATGPPPRIQAATSDPPLPPNESPHFGVATQVANAMADSDMNRTLTPTDLSRRLGARRRECRRDIGAVLARLRTQDSWLGQVRILISSLFHLVIISFWLTTGQHYHLWWVCARPIHLLDRGTSPRWLGIACPRSDGSSHDHIQPYRFPH